MKYNFFSDGSFAKKVMGFGAFLSSEANGVNPVNVLWQSWDAIQPRKDSSTSTSEYHGLELIIDYLERNPLPRKSIRIFMDSEFITKQCRGEYAMNEFNQRTGKRSLYYDKGLEIQKRIKKLGLRPKNFKWIPRAKNQYADKLSNAYKLDNENSIPKINVAQRGFREVREAERVA